MSGLLTPEEWGDIALRCNRPGRLADGLDARALYEHIVAVAEAIRELPQYMEVEDGRPTETVSRRKALRLLLPCACPD